MDVKAPVKLMCWDGTDVLNFAAVNQRPGLLDIPVVDQPR